LGYESFTIIYARQEVDKVFAFDDEFRRIRRLLKDEPDEDEKKVRQEIEEKINKSMWKRYINSIFLFVTYLITLFHLFSAL